MTRSFSLVQAGTKRYINDRVVKLGPSRDIKLNK